ncbi:MAG: hypothetical protein PVI66_07130 [Candidatus Aminicenantes bacterium]
MKVWQQNFAYRTSIEFWTFLVAAGLAFLIAMLKISYQSVKEALSDPVAPLLYEQ